MKTKSQVSTSILLIMIVILTACARTSSIYQAETSLPNETSTVLPTECIPPITNLAIPVGLDVQPPQQVQVPPKNWQMIAGLPEPASQFLNSFAIQGDDVWISYGGPNGSKLLKYNLVSKTWEFYEPLGDQDVGPAQVFITRNGTLWIFYRAGIDSENANLSLLSRYNKSNDQFEIVVDYQKILQYPTELRSKVVEDDNGLLWMFIKDVRESSISLYSLDPLTLHAQKHPLYLNTYLGSVTIGPSGKVWTANLLDGTLLQYDPVKHEIHSFDSLPETAPDTPGFKLTDMIKGNVYPYADSSGRLWLGNQGWLDIRDVNHLVLYKLLPSPVFVGYFEGPQPGYALSPAVFNIYQSTNGWIWFTTNIGVVQLKIQNGYQQGNWCLVTNGHSPIMEDGNNNLWMIVFDKIYKLHIRP